MTSQDEDACRNKFEAWAKNRYRMPDWFFERPNGQYSCANGIDQMWETWRSAWEACLQ